MEKTSLYKSFLKAVFLINEHLCALLLSDALPKNIQRSTSTKGVTAPATEVGGNIRIDIIYSMDDK